MRIAARRHRRRRRCQAPLADHMLTDWYFQAY